MALDILRLHFTLKLDGDRNTRVALFQKRAIRRTIHDGEWWFVITDIVAALTDSPDPSGYWKKMRKRDPDLSKALEGGDNLSPPFPWSLRLLAGLRKCSVGTQRAFSG
jgi:hypothetical protein